MDGYTVHLCQYKRTNGPSREKKTDPDALRILVSWFALLLIRAGDRGQGRAGTDPGRPAARTNPDGSGK